MSSDTRRPEEFLTEAEYEQFLLVSTMCEGVDPRDFIGWKPKTEGAESEGS